jgi:hypothetical protein
VLSLKQSVEHFKQEFGFFPPLVMDMGGIPPGATAPPVQTIAGQLAPRTYSLSVFAENNFLRTNPPPDVADYRFSIYTLPYYIIGVLDEERGGTGPDATAAIDGLKGPGFRTPLRDGRFEHTGRTFQPLFAVGSGSTTLYHNTGSTAGPWGHELRDANGVAFRYYRWEPKQNPLATDSLRERLRTPWIIGDPDENAALRSARWAIVGAGINGLFGNEAQLDSNHPQHRSWNEMAVKLGLSVSTPPTPEEMDAIMRKAMEDNIVEVGQ